MSTKTVLPKVIKVVPGFASEKNPKHDDNTQDPEEILRELKGEDSETENMRQTVFSKTKTKEEQTTGQNTNTFLIVAFAIIVIALISLIVWMVTKQNDTKNEEDMKQIIRPHNRNNLPPQQQAMLAQQQNYKMQQMQQMYQMQRAQEQKQNSMGEPGKAEDNSKEGKVNTQSQSVSQAAAPAKPPSESTQPAKPQSESAPSRAELDEVYEKTQAMLAEDESELTEKDEMLINQFANETYQE